MSSAPKPARRRPALPQWWLASLLFHALLFGWLLFFSPVRIIDLSASRANFEANVSPARAAEVMEQVRQQEAVRLSEDVLALEEARGEIAALEAGMREELWRDWTNEADALEKIAAAQDNAARAEATAATALSNAVSQALPSQAGLAELTNLSAAVGQAQAGASQFQAQALEALAKADPSFQTAYEAQAQANVAQSRATQAQAEAQGQLASAAALGAKLPDAIAQASRQSAAGNLRQARQSQAEAVTAQARAAKAFADARDGVALAPLDQVPQADDLAGVYDAAVNNEGLLSEAYQRLRATDLARQRRIPLARALELTDAARPARPDLAASLSGSPASASDVAAQRQAMLEARLQIAAMRSLADSMLEQAHALSEEPAEQQSLDQLAAEDENQRAKDLSGAMRGGEDPASAQPGEGEAGSGEAGSGETGPGRAGAGRAGTGPDLGGTGRGKGRGRGYGPPAVPRNLRAVPGRVIGAGAVPERWMFVDSWYLLGPFDNTGRANIERQFPPETVVDLNATYVGKRGRPIHWEFYQSPQPGVVPPFDGYNPLLGGSAAPRDVFHARDLEYIIYYGYTELRAAQDCNVWITVGSDDFSKLWIEDQLVWASGKQLKSWRVDEGFRKIHLKRGVNRVLYRVENGHGATEFSLAVCAQ